MYIPFHKPYLDEQVIDAVSRVIRSGLIGSGPFVKRFERLFGKYVGASHSVAVNSCTSALHLALLVAGIGPGDEVITTSVTFSSTINAILYTGATPLIVDVNEDDLCMNVLLIESKITSKTKAILPVHYAGMPCDLDVIRSLCKKYHLILIEDAAHAVSTTYKSTKIGKDYEDVKELTCFSFQATKNISIGDGGMITTADADMAKKMSELRLFGMSAIDNKDSFLDATMRFQQQYVGYKYNMTDIEAAIGIKQLEKLDVMNQLREEAADYYTQQLSKLPYIECPIEKDGYGKTWYIYVIRIKEEYFKQGMQQKIIEYLGTMGIQTSIHFLPVFQIPAFQKYFKEDSEKCIVAKTYTQRIVSLPFYPGLTIEEIDYVVDCIQKYFEVEG
jgi:dTDP-4-amino-4,6-dideoxygalactose transaminase